MKLILILNFISVLSTTLALAGAAKAQAPASLNEDAPSPSPSSEAAPAAAVPAPAVLPPRPLSDTPPVHPLPPEEAARLGRVEVAVVILIGEAGDVRDAQLAAEPGTSDERLRLTALEYARGLQFEPARRNGVAVAARIRILVPFEAPPSPPPPTPPPVPVVAQPSPVPATPPTAPAVEAETTVTVRMSAERALRRSAQAVKVLVLEEVAVQSTDMGAVLERAEGVDVRTAGGLGADSTFSLNGLSGQQVRLLVDGVPLELAGYGQDIASVPVALIERVEIYKGVVPLALGADALGGAVNLVSSDRYHRPLAHASYQVGSFGTHRAVVQARQPFTTGGLFLGVNAFLDRTANDYRVRVPLVSSDGGERLVDVPRFHDAYQAAGASLETGVRGRSWSDRLVLRLHFAGTTKEIQHNPLMTKAYGEPETGSRTVGATLRYAKEGLWGGRLGFGLLVNAGLRRLTLWDASSSVYGWDGQVVRSVAPHRGEIDKGVDAHIDEKSAMARLDGRLRVADGHVLEAAVSPQTVGRRGDDRIDETPLDLLNRPQRRTVVVSGLGWNATLFGGRVENVLFGKSYLFHVAADQEVQGGVDQLSRTTHAFGGGDGLRVLLGAGFMAKASYEYAIRLPTATETFGDGLVLAANPRLAPERSHNINLSLLYDQEHGRIGRFGGELTAFRRDTRDQITLNTTQLLSQYRNLLAARGQGAEGSVSWRASGEWLGLFGSAAYNDLRNTSKTGPYAPFEGDRVPNQPFFSAFGEVRLQRRATFVTADVLSAYWNSRFVEEFFRFWESPGLRDSKARVPAQLVHTAGITYRLGAALVANLEMQNITDARTYDLFGIQRPGRAVFFKLSGTLEFASPRNSNEKG